MGVDQEDCTGRVNDTRETINDLNLKGALIRPFIVST